MREATATSAVRNTLRDGPPAEAAYTRFLLNNAFVAVGAIRHVTRRRSPTGPEPYRLTNVALVRAPKTGESTLAYDPRLAVSAARPCTERS